MTSTLATRDVYRLARDIYRDPSGVLAQLAEVRLPKRLPIMGARLAILARRPFDAGNLTGVNANRYAGSGILPSDWWSTFHQDTQDWGAFVVYSYATPIAWERSDGLRVVPRVTYSVSTTRHQGEVRAAWGMGWSREYSHPTRSMASL